MNQVIVPSAIVMVGLPARGKTYIARKLSRYFNWIGIKTKVFNVGDERRKYVPDSLNNADFFKSDNPEATEKREICAMKVLQQMVSWLKDGGEVGVYDATNSNKLRRKNICSYLFDECGIKILFIESLCNNSDVIEANIREVKVSSPDYMGVDKDSAIEDFRNRIKNYEKVYEQLDEKEEKELSFIKIYDQGVKYLVNNINGHIQSRAVYYLMNIHVLPRTIYITRHGETLMNQMKRLGGDSDLSENGQKFAKELAKFLSDQNVDNLRVWSSLMKECKQTAIHFPLMSNQIEHWKALNEIDAGICEGLTYEEIEEKFPEEFELRKGDKYFYRYPAGESYHDVVCRLEPVIMHLERLSNVLVICHQAIARCLLAYFMDTSREELPYLEVPLHRIYKLTPIAYGCKVEIFDLNVPATNMYVPKTQGIVEISSYEQSRAKRKLSVTNMNEGLIKSPSESFLNPLKSFAE